MRTNKNVPWWGRSRFYIELSGLGFPAALLGTADCPQIHPYNRERNLCRETYANPIKRRMLTVKIENKLVPCTIFKCRRKMASVFTFIAQLYIKQCVYTVDCGCANIRMRISASGRQSTQQSSEVVKRHHVLEKKVQKLKKDTKINDFS